MQISQQHWGPQANAMAESVEKTSTKIINISSRWQVKGDFRSKRSVDWTLLSGGLHQMIRISWWRNQMETFSFSALLSFVRGIHRSPVNFPHKRPVTHSFDIFFYLRLTKRLSKNGENGDLRRHRAIMSLARKMCIFLFKFGVLWDVEQVHCDIGLLFRCTKRISIVPFYQTVMNWW